MLSSQCLSCVNNSVFSSADSESLRLVSSTILPLQTIAIVLVKYVTATVLLDVYLMFVAFRGWNVGTPGIEKRTFTSV